MPRRPFPPGNALRTVPGRKNGRPAIIPDARFAESPLLLSREDILELVDSALDLLRNPFAALLKGTAQILQVVGRGDRFGDGDNQLSIELLKGLSHRLSLADIGHFDGRERNIRRGLEHIRRERNPAVGNLEETDHQLFFGSALRLLRLGRRPEFLACPLPILRCLAF